MRPVIVRRGRTFPCTLPVSGLIASSQESTCAMRFCSIMYRAISCASGMSISERILSSTTTLPRSVLFSGTQPISINRSATCLRDPGLKGMYLVLVFSWTSVGGKVSCICSLIVLSSSVSSATSIQAFCSSSLKPLDSCSDSMALTLCSSLMHPGEKEDSSFFTCLNILTDILVSCIQYSPISSENP